VPIPKPPIPTLDRLGELKAEGARAELALETVGPLMAKREEDILRQALSELRNSQLTPDRAFMHIAAINGLRALREDLEHKVRRATDAARSLVSLDERFAQAALAERTE
jgi:hypothetical protein